MSKCEEVIVNSGHGLFFQLKNEMHVIVFWVGFEGRLTIPRKAERIVDTRVWVKVCVEMDRVYGEADLCAMRNMEPVPQVDAFRCDDLGKKYWPNVSPIMGLVTMEKE